MSTNGGASWRADALGEMRELELSGSRMRCFERGSGPPIVFLHGVLSNANLWRHVVERLAPRFRCVTLDLPLGAHTLAMPGADRTLPGIVRMISEAVAAADLDGATLVANDSGGVLAQMVAAGQPEWLDKLVLTSCEFGSNCPPTVFWPMGPIARIPGGLLLYLAPGQLSPLQRLPVSYGWLAKRRLEPRVAATYVRPALAVPGVRGDLAAFLRDYGSRHTLAAARALPRFTRPALVAWSSEDRLFPPDHGRALARLMPRATLSWIHDSYAYSPEDRPDAVAHLVAEFVGSANGSSLRKPVQKP